MVSYTAICGSPANITCTGIVEYATSELPLAVTVMEPVPSAVELGTMLRSTDVGFEDTVTLVGLIEQLTPVKEDVSQPIVTAPVNPPFPETSQLLVLEEGV
jgi:hypothetical protein